MCYACVCVCVQLCVSVFDGMSEESYLLSLFPSLYFLIIVWRYVNGMGKGACGLKAGLSLCVYVCL